MAVVAEIQDHGPRTKPFLGGWRNTVTGLIYHNACTQTYRNGKTTRNGITQTIVVMDAITEVFHDQAVQVQFLPDTHDKIIAPGISSFGRAPADEIESSSSQTKSRIVDSVIKIQRCYRAYRAGVAAKTDTFQVANVCQENDERDVTEYVRHFQPSSTYNGTDFAILNLKLPRTRSDFESLRNLLDRWRILETERACRTLFGSSRLAACGLILSKEIELLRTVDSMKVALCLKYRERKRRKFLDDLSRSVAWQGNRGRPILVDTLRVQRARQHRIMYTSLVNEELSVSERIDLLYAVRSVAGMHTCRESLELVYLVDQELDLLMRRVDTNRLDWLRKRLKLSFLKLARNALQGDLEEDMHRFDWSDTSITRLCRTCGKLLSLDKFPRERRLRSSSCIYCTSMRTRRGLRIVYEPYERMLREVRRFEAKMGCYGSLAFMVGVKVIYNLVNDIWHGRSGISEDDDLDELRLIRFQRELEWAPWNSLLLTKTEAAIHRGISDIEAFYDSMILQRFRMKNLQAKMYFETISAAPRNIVTPSSIED